MSRFALTAALMLLAPQATPHPHVFVDGTLGFVIDDDGHLSHLRVVWVMDAYYSLFALQDIGVDQDGDGSLTAEEKSRLAAHFSNWQPEFRGDSGLWADGERLALGGPEGGEADLLEDGRIRMEFTRSVNLPFDPRVAEVTAKAFDPSFYTYYAITEAPTVTGDETCQATHETLEASTELQALQAELLDYDPYATPEDGNVGEKLADTIRLTCEPRPS